MGRSVFIKYLEETGILNDDFEDVKAVELRNRWLTIVDCDKRHIHIKTSLIEFFTEKVIDEEGVA